jgi:(2Fe-2S) ferredoxin
MGHLFPRRKIGIMLPSMKHELKSDLGNYKSHVFVCTNDKKCGPRGAEKLRKELKDWAKENPDWKKRIRINSAGCLDRCTEPVAIVIYPQNKWITNVDLDDMDAIKREIEKIMAE